MSNFVEIAYFPHLQEGPESFAPLGFNPGTDYPSFSHILPGYNQIDAKVWAQMQSHPVFAAKLACGALRELDLTKKADRLDQVKGTWDLTDLYGMAETEKSPEVKAEIEAQIKRLKEANAPSEWRSNVPGASKIDFLSHSGLSIWRKAYKLPGQVTLLNQQFASSANSVPWK